MRLLCLALLAGCSNPTFNTGAASLSVGPAESGGAPSANSASSGSLAVALEDGGSLLGWSVEFYADAPGTDCFKEQESTTTFAADLRIYTNQPGTPSQRLAHIPTGAI